MFAKKYFHMKTAKEYELQYVCGEPLLVPTDEENASKQSVINLDELTAYLWAELQKIEEFDIDTMIALLQREYEVDNETAREDCGLIIEAWAEMGLVTM